ncbi:MAG TPA: hypothetical protein DEG88_02075 [Propionibacteriaceae bacterium]|nr:hypothetical protein [Propionibacteriaceae bacterium]HBY22116.1 hypothetical protein [Propionibacteriaceae bacterium]
MTTQHVRPRGRRPGHEDTRGDIACAALRLFDRQGYDGASLRAIAREAGVDPALVHHYFDSKAQLFAAVLFQSDLDLVERFDRVLAEGDYDTLGHRTAKSFIEMWEHPHNNAPLLAFLQDKAQARRRLIAEFLGREVFGRMAAAAGHSNGILRGQMAATTMLGLMTGRHILEMGALSAASTPQHRRADGPRAAALHRRPLVARCGGRPPLDWAGKPIRRFPWPTRAALRTPACSLLSPPSTRTSPCPPYPMSPGRWICAPGSRGVRGRRGPAAHCCSQRPPSSRSRCCW